MGKTQFKTSILEEKQNVLRIILNRLDKMNALNAQMYTEFRSVLYRVDLVIDAILGGNASVHLKLSP